MGHRRAKGRRGPDQADGGRFSETSGTMKAYIASRSSKSRSTRVPWTRTLTATRLPPQQPWAPPTAAHWHLPQQPQAPPTAATGTSHGSSRAPPTAAQGLSHSSPLAPPTAATGTYHGSHGEEVGMIATFLQVHHDVEQRHLVPAPLGVQCLEVPREDELVVLPTAGHRGAVAGHTSDTSLRQGWGRGQVPICRETRGALRGDTTGLEPPSKLLGDTELRQPQSLVTEAGEEAARRKRVGKVCQGLRDAEESPAHPGSSPGRLDGPSGGVAEETAQGKWGSCSRAGPPRPSPTHFCI